MPDPEKNAGRDDLSDRLDRLKDRLDQTKSPEPPVADKETSSVQKANIGQALRLGSEFVAGIVVGAALGFGFDSVFDTSPWGFIAFFLLGFAAAVLNVMRAAGLVAESGMRLKNAQELAKQREAETVRKTQPPAKGNHQEKD